MYGVEAAGFGIETGKHSAPLNAGHVGVLHGNRTYLMSDEQVRLLRHTVSRRTLIIRVLVLNIAS